MTRENHSGDPPALLSSVPLNFDDDDGDDVKKRRKYMPFR
jgi:hypothetical protein